MQLNFVRGEEIGRDQSRLPVAHYRKLLSLYSREKGPALFIPVRSMQYLGIFDRTEIVFVDGQCPRVIELAWRDFHQDEKGGLSAPVQYTCIYYTPAGKEIFGRLQGEFTKAVDWLAARQPDTPGQGTVVRIDPAR